MCQDPELSENFILMNDDFFILKPIKDPISELNLCRGTIQEVLIELRKRNGDDTPYTVSMAQTQIFLQDLGYKEPLSYELHTPMVINKNSFLSIFSLPHIDSISAGHQRSIYGNLFLKNSKKIKDVKVYKNFQTDNTNETFLSTEDNSWPMVKPYIDRLFPNKSPYEL